MYFIVKLRSVNFLLNEYCIVLYCRYCIKTAKRRISQTTPRDSPGTLVFGAEGLGKLERGHPNGGVKCMWGRLK